MEFLVNKQEIKLREQKWQVLFKLLEALDDDGEKDVTINSIPTWKNTGINFKYKIKKNIEPKYKCRKFKKYKPIIKSKAIKRNNDVKAKTDAKIKSTNGKLSENLKNTDMMDLKIVQEFEKAYFNTYKIDRELLRRVAMHDPEIYGLWMKHLIAMDLNNIEFMNLTKKGLNRSIKRFKGDVKELEAYFKYFSFMFDICKAVKN